MENNFFTFQGKQYVIFFDHFNMKILRKEDDELFSLTEEEQEEITKLLTQESGYQYYSDYLVQLVKSNDNLENKEYLYNFLQWLENLIPEESRENFYHNVKTLKTELNLSMNSTMLEESKETGCYNVKENKLTMNKDSILKTWEIAKKTQNPKDFFWKSYSQTLLHELAHMVSSNYNLKRVYPCVVLINFLRNKKRIRIEGLPKGLQK